MDINDYDVLMKKRGSCRSFNCERQVSKEDLIKILEVAKLSPSACNSQPYSVYVVNADEELVKEMRNTKVGGFNKFIDDCNSFLIITEARYTLPAKIGSVMRGTDFRAIDIGIFTANLVNAATTIGLETCILGLFAEKKIKKIIGSSDRVRLVIAVGYPKDEYSIEEKKRKLFDSHIHFVLPSSKE